LAYTASISFACRGEKWNGMQSGTPRTNPLFFTRELSAHKCYSGTMHQHPTPRLTSIVLCSWLCLSCGVDDQSAVDTQSPDVNEACEAPALPILPRTRSAGACELQPEADTVEPAICELGLDVDAVVWGRIVDYGRRATPTWTATDTESYELSDEPCPSVPGGPFVVVLDVGRVVGDPAAAQRTLEIRLGRVEVWLDPFPSEGATASEVTWIASGDDAGEPLQVGQFIGMPVEKVEGYDFWVSDTRFMFTEAAGPDCATIHFPVFEYEKNGCERLWPPADWHGRTVDDVMTEMQTCREGLDTALMSDVRALLESHWHRLSTDPRQVFAKYCGQTTKAP